MVKFIRESTQATRLYQQVAEYQGVNCYADPVDPQYLGGHYFNNNGAISASLSSLRIRNFLSRKTKKMNMCLTRIFEREGVLRNGECVRMRKNYPLSADVKREDIARCPYNIRRLRGPFPSH
jgi:hypothetical protein